MAINKATIITTGEVRLSYEHLLKPYANQPGAEAKYSITLLIPKSDIATRQRIDAAIQAAAQEGVTGKWGGVRPAQLPVPIYDGDGVRQNGEAFGPECKGHWVMTASSKQQPEVVGLDLQPIMQATEIYSGMYAHVCVNFFAYFNAGKKGIGAGLGPVQKTRDGEPLGGRVSAEEAFGGGYAAPAPGYSQPAYQQPASAQPVAVPPWHTPAYPAQAPVSFPGGTPAAPQQPAVNPITGQSYTPAAGGVMGI